jgi:hypothetical protein
MQQAHGKNGDKKVKYLNFNLYGSPSGPRCWNVALHNKFLKMGFDQSTTDPSLYKRGELHVCVFVYDCLCTFPPNDKSVADYKEFAEDISDSFALRDDGDGMTDTNEFCGMCIEWAPWKNNSGAYFKITAPKEAVNSVLRAMNFDDGCRTAATPLPSKAQCRLSDCPQKGPAGDADRDFMADKNYFGHLGTLSWVHRVCRPDLGPSTRMWMSGTSGSQPRKSALEVATALRAVPPRHTRHGTGIRATIGRQHHGDDTRRLDRLRLRTELWQRVWQLSIHIRTIILIQQHTSTMGIPSTGSTGDECT